MSSPYFDSDQAVAEGWIMGDRSGDAVLYAIETLDDPSDHEGNTGKSFDSDGLAYIHVALAAAAGSAYHQAALDFLKEHSPVAYDWVLSWIPAKAA